MVEAGDDFADFIWGHVGGQPMVGDGLAVPASTPASMVLSKALKAKGFKFVGAVTVYAFMQAVGMSTITRSTAQGKSTAGNCRPPRSRPSLVTQTIEFKTR